MKILIIEDEAPAFRRLQNVLDEIDPNIEIVEVIDSVDDAVKWFNNHAEPDLILMDIQLSDGVSFEIFDQVKISRPVIFTTAFDEYMLKAFKVNSIDYLLKPIKKEDLQLAIKKYKNLKQAFSADQQPIDLNLLISKIKMDERRFKSRFLIRKGDQLLSVETQDINYLFTKNGVVYLVTKDNNQYLMDFNLDEVMTQLDPEKFYRINRQYIIAFKAIKATHKYYKGKLLIELNQKTEEPLTVSAEKATAFKQWLGNI